MEPEQMRDMLRETADRYRRSGDLAQARECQARAEVWDAFARTDWTGPNPENGFYRGRGSEEAGGVDPESWDHQRHMTPVALLRGHLLDGYGGTLPVLWRPPERNPVPGHVPDADWEELRAEMLARARETAAGLGRVAAALEERAAGICSGEIDA